MGWHSLHLIVGAPYHIWSTLNYSRGYYRWPCHFKPTTWDPRGLPLREIGACWLAHTRSRCSPKRKHSFHKSSDRTMLVLKIHIVLDQLKEKKRKRKTSKSMLWATLESSFFLSYNMSNETSSPNCKISINNSNTREYFLSHMFMMKMFRQQDEFAMSCI